VALTTEEQHFAAEELNQRIPDIGNTLWSLDDCGIMLKNTLSTGQRKWRIVPLSSYIDA